MPWCESIEGFSLQKDSVLDGVFFSPFLPGLKSLKCEVRRKQVCFFLRCISCRQTAYYICMPCGCMPCREFYRVGIITYQNWPPLQRMELEGQPLDSWLLVMLSYFWTFATHLNYPWISFSPSRSMFLHIKLELVSAFRVVCNVNIKPTLATKCIQFLFCNLCSIEKHSDFLHAYAVLRSLHFASSFSSNWQK